MIFLAMASMLIGVSQVPAETPIPAKIKENLQCRAIVVGVSRSGDVLVCRTRAEWRRYDSCRGSVTRYCAPKNRTKLGTATSFALSEDSRIICRNLKATGSRLATQRVCLPQREWQRMWDETSKAVAVLQDKSMKVPEIPR